MGVVQSSLPSWARARIGNRKSITSQRIYIKLMFLKSTILIHNKKNPPSSSGGFFILSNANTSYYSASSLFIRLYSPCKAVSGLNTIRNRLPSAPSSEANTSASSLGISSKGEPGTGSVEHGCIKLQRSAACVEICHRVLASKPPWRMVTFELASTRSGNHFGFGSFLLTLRLTGAGSGRNSSQCGQGFFCKAYTLKSQG